MMSRVQKMILQDKAKKMVGQFSDQDLWDRYKNAKLMDDKEEVFVFRQVIAMQTGQRPR